MYVQYLLYLLVFCVAPKVYLISFSIFVSNAVPKNLYKISRKYVNRLSGHMCYSFLSQHTMFD